MKSKRSPEAAYRRSIKRDALTRDHTEGCRCPNVRARVRVTDKGYDVVTEPHNHDCVLKHRKADVVVPSAEDLSIPGAVPRDAPEHTLKDLTVVDGGGLWLP